MSRARSQLGVIFLQLFTVTGFFWSERIPFALACAARMVVMIGIFCASDALRIVTSSSRGIFPLGVLMMKLNVAVDHAIEHVAAGLREV